MLTFHIQDTTVITRYAWCVPRGTNVHPHAIFCLQRGKTVPEELVKPEELSKYRQVASHVVSSTVLSRTHPLLSTVQTHSSVAGQCQGGHGSLHGDQCCSGGGFQQSPLQDLLGSLWGIFLLVAPTWPLSASHRGCTVPAFQESWPWTSVLPTPTRSSLVREPHPSLLSAQTLQLPGNGALSLTFCEVGVSKGA